LTDYQWTATVENDDAGEPGSRVFVHLDRGPERDNWLNVPRKFLRVPQVGEYVSLNCDGPWAKVVLVVHCPFKDEYGAEIYCKVVDHLDPLREAAAAVWPSAQRNASPPGARPK
jgi:hypothetical protein